ncbi:MAG: hypothetical protein GXO88_11995 [Chlorobi bacterium]|nr:hypothetical protein [Chlorobiota bacterium]
MNKSTIKGVFEKRSGSNPIVGSSAGRINLIKKESVSSFKELIVLKYKSPLGDTARIIAGNIPEETKIIN